MSAWPAVIPTLTVCVYYAKDEYTNGDGMFVDPATFYDGVPVAALMLVTEKLLAKCQQELVRSFSYWPTHDDARRKLRLTGGKPHSYYKMCKDLDAPV